MAVARARARLEEADGSLAELDVVLGKRTLRAPFAATVGERMLDPGARVSPGQPVLRLFDSGPRHLRVGLPPEVIQVLEPGKHYAVTLDSREHAPLQATFKS